MHDIENDNMILCPNILQYDGKICISKNCLSILATASKEVFIVATTFTVEVMYRPVYGSFFFYFWNFLQRKVGLYKLASLTLYIYLVQQSPLHIASQRKAWEQPPETPKDRANNVNISVNLYWDIVHFSILKWKFLFDTHQPEWIHASNSL